MENSAINPTKIDKINTPSYNGSIGSSFLNINTHTSVAGVGTSSSIEFSINNDGKITVPVLINEQREALEEYTVVMKDGIFTYYHENKEISAAKGMKPATFLRSIEQVLVQRAEALATKKLVNETIAD